MSALVRVKELTVGAIVRCDKSVVDSGFVKIVATQSSEQVSHLARNKWRILAVECDENGELRNTNYFEITQEEIDKWAVHE